MLRVGLEQRKLPVGAALDVRCKGSVFAPKGRGRPVLHAGLEWLNAPALFVVQCAGNGVVQTTRGKVGLKARVDGLRVVLIQPRIKFGQLLRRQRSDSVFDLLDRV